MEQLLEKTTSATGIAHEHYSNFLRSVSLFSEFERQDLDEVLRKSMIRTYPNKSLLFLTGDEAEFFYVIVSGWIKLFRETPEGHETVISVLSHHDVFGNNAIVKGTRFAYSAEAVSNATLLQVPSAFMLHMAKDHTSYDSFLTKFLKSEFSRTDQYCLEAEHLSKKTSKERVGCFLLKMCDGQKEGEVHLLFPYEKSLAAGRLGMAPETFSRCLNQLAPMGVETHENRVTIHQVERLRQNICSDCSALRKECALSYDGEVSV